MTGVSVGCCNMCAKAFVPDVDPPSPEQIADGSATAAPPRADQNGFLTLLEVKEAAGEIIMGTTEVGSGGTGAVVGVGTAASNTARPNRGSRKILLDARSKDTQHQLKLQTHAMLLHVDSHRMGREFSRQRRAVAERKSTPPWLGHQQAAASDTALGSDEGALLRAQPERFARLGSMRQLLITDSVTRLGPQDVKPSCCVPCASDLYNAGPGDGPFGEPQNENQKNQARGD